VLSGTGAYDNKNAGTLKTVAATGITAAGSNGGKTVYGYAVAPTTANAAIGTINARAITVTAASDSKTYDGTTNSAGAPAVTTGTLAIGDTSAFSQTFDTRNAGSGKTLSAAGVVNDGNLGANYAVTFVNNSTGVITPATIANVSGITANNKVYDATTSATLNTGAAGFTGILGADVLTVATATGAFADKNAATG
jgi:hypothetical protein